MSIQLTQFLDKYHTDKFKNTHTCTYKSVYGIVYDESYKIPVSEKETLIDLLNDSLERGFKVCLNEEIERGRPTIIRAKLCHGYFKSDKRIEQIVKLYQNEINCLMTPTSEQLMAFVFEGDKSNYYINDESEIDEIDGIRLMFPYLVCDIQIQHLMRERVLSHCRETLTIGPYDAIEPIINKRSIDITNWMMYGCSKLDENPHKLTKVIDHKGNYLDINLDIKTSISLFSIRDHPIEQSLQIKPEYAYLLDGDKKPPKKIIKRHRKKNEHNQMSTNEIVYCLKSCLEKAKINDDQIIVSQQINPISGTRNYRSFHTIDLLKANFDNNQNQFMYEVLPEGLPRYLYFDLETTTDVFHHTIEEIVDQLIIAVWKTTTQFTDQVLEQEIDVEISTASKDNKLSYHIKFSNIIFENVNELKKYINVFKSVVKDDPFFKTDNNKLLIDFQPYGVNQNFRMLYQSKNGSNRTLQPIMDSSKLLIDHLVGYYDKSIKPFTHVIREETPTKEKDLLKRELGGSSSYQSNFSLDQLESCQEKEVINIDNLDDPQQLLSCIPNSSQSWSTWITIGMCLHQLGDQYRQDWINWSNMSHKGTTQDCVRQWNTFVRDKARSVGLTRLRTIALHYQPHNKQLFGDEQTAISDFVNLQSDGIEEETYNQQYVKPYPFDNNKFTTVIEQSQMGTGKTYQAKETIKSLLEVNPEARILFMSARVTFSVSMTAEINRDINTNFELYKKVKGDLCDIPQLMIQMESLHKLDGAKPYDLVILDESESCLKQFSSEQTMKSKLAEVTKVFQTIIKGCHWLLVCDAFISNRSLIITELRNLDQCLLRKNLFVSKKRKVIMIKKKKILVTTLIEKLEEGYKCFFVSASKKLIKGIEERYKDQYTILSYHADKDDHHIDTLKNVNQTWSQCDLVMCSATITIGINFNIEYFDYCFLYGSSYGATPRDLLQSHMRVRHLNKSTIFCHIYGTKCPVKRSEYRLKDIADRGYILEKINLPHAVYKKEAPTWLKKIMFLSQLEDNLSGQYVLQLYKHYFHTLGYEIDDFGKDPEDIIEINDSGNYPNYSQIKNITEDEYHEISEAVKFGESTFLDRCKLHKYEFDYCLKALESDKHLQAKQILFSRYFKDPLDRQKFFKIVKEVKALEKPEKLTKPDIYYGDLQISSNLLTSLVIDVIKNLGLQHSQDIETRIKEELINLLPKNIPNLDQKVKMLIPSHHKITDQSDDPLKLINRILEQHGFTKCTKQRGRHRVNGKLIDEPYYQLIPNNPCYDDDYASHNLVKGMKSILEPIPKGNCLL